MNQTILPLLLGMGQGASGGQSSGGSTLMSFLPIVAIIAIFYFLIIRPQSKKQKETKRMLDALKKGDKIVTIGGIHGVIQTVRESSVIVRVDESTKMEFSRSAIASVEAVAKVKDEEPSPAELAEKSVEKESE
jgi:preprotein translocase subunit YajC